MNIFSKNQISLYIGSDYIEVVVLGKNFKDTITLKNVYRKNISLSDIDLNDQNEIIKNTVADIFVSNGLSRKNVILNIPTHDIILRTFQMPRLPKEEWDKAVKFEGQKYVPFKLNEMISDFCILDQYDTSSNMNVLFLCTRISVALRYISILKSIGITCKNLNSIFVSMIRLVSFLKIVDSEQPTLIISVKKKVFGRDKMRYFADILVAYKNVPFLARDISIVGSKDEVDEKFLNELYLSVKLFNSSLGEKQIEQVFFLQGKEIYKWDTFFSENFNAKVSFVDVNEIFGVKIVDGITIGAALNGWILSDLDINLLSSNSKDLIETQINFDMKKINNYEFIIFFVIFCLFFVFFYIKKIGVKKEFNKINQKMNTYASLSENEILLKKEEKEFSKDFKSYYKKRKIYLSKKIIKIANIIEKNSWIEQIVFKNHLKIKGKYNAQLFINGNVYMQDKVKDMLLVNSMKNKIEKNKIIMKKFKFCKIDNLKPVNRGDLNLTSFSIKLSTKKE